MAKSSKQAEPAKPGLQMFTSRQFVPWLVSTGSSLVVTTYQSGKIIFIGTNITTGKMTVFERTLERPMGLAVTGKKLSVASLFQIYTFVDVLEEGQVVNDCDALFVPRFSNFTGDLDVHDIAHREDGGITFANTLFSCLAATSLTHSFKPVWKPPFISRLAEEDRCHLNGMAIRDGRPAYVSAIGSGDVADSWRDHRVSGGIVIDVESNQTICTGLSMPHSPRWHQGRLFVLNSGRGEIGEIDLKTGAFNPIAFLPGYLRGLSFIGDFAVVGLSAPRENRTFDGLDLQVRLDKESMSPRSGLSVVNINTGDVAHWLTMEGIFTELFDVAVLPGIKNPSMIGFKTDEIRRVLSIDGN